jgi:hypothetical protein
VITRRCFLTSLSMASTAPGILAEMSPPMESKPPNTLTINPYKWEGPYADHRTGQKAFHDWRLCADLRGEWPGRCERLILRTSEIIGYETGFLYDDHLPPSEPEGRGKSYHHIPFEWRIVSPGKELFADCLAPQKGKFSIRLTARADWVDIDLTVRNDMRQPMENVDWAFCAVALESPSLADSEATRTYLFDGKRLQTLAAIAGRDIHLYKVAGAHGFIPVGHRAIAVGPVEAQASVVIIESQDGTHSAALGFQQADHIYGDAKGNKCFHADPYFGPQIKPGEERSVHGKLYLIKGNAEEALRRYQKDFTG